jgi:hypothetical protein
MIKSINISKASRITRYVIPNLYQLDENGKKLYASVQAKKHGKKFIVSKFNNHAYWGDGESVVGEYALGCSILKKGRVEMFELKRI